MRKALIVIALLAAAACKQESTPPQTAAGSLPSQEQQALTPEQLGELGAQIHRHPADAQKLLAEHHLTPEAFEKAIRDVAQNPDAARRYRDAYKKSG